jgi:hypothetical protein
VADGTQKLPRGNSSSSKSAKEALTPKARAVKRGQCLKALTAMVHRIMRPLSMVERWLRKPIPDLDANILQEVLGVNLIGRDAPFGNLTWEIRGDTVVYDATEHEQAYNWKNSLSLGWVELALFEGLLKKKGGRLYFGPFVLRQWAKRFQRVLGTTDLENYGKMIDDIVDEAWCIDKDPPLGVIEEIPLMGYVLTMLFQLLIWKYGGSGDEVHYPSQLGSVRVHGVEYEIASEHMRMAYDLGLVKIDRSKVILRQTYADQAAMLLELAESYGLSFEEAGEAVVVATQATWTKRPIFYELMNDMSSTLLAFYLAGTHKTFGSRTSKAKESA